MKKRGEYYITQFFYLNLQTLIFIGKMKQLKFLMVALTLLMGISFTSCLNSDNDYAPTVGGFVKVGGGVCWVLHLQCLMVQQQLVRRQHL